MQIMQFRGKGRWFLLISILVVLVAGVVFNNPSQSTAVRVQVVETRYIRTAMIPFTVTNEVEGSVGWIGYEPREVPLPDWPNCGDSPEITSCLLRQYTFEVRYLLDGELWGFLTTDFVHSGGYIDIDDQNIYKISE